jgi:carbon monoxide dehydrogenase subunit G
MTTYESEIKTISANNEVVFAKLSDLSNIEKLKDQIPENTGISDLKCDMDSVSFKINPVGQIGLRIIEREAYKTIKLEADNSPVPFNMWIQLVGKEDGSTKLKLTIRTELPMMIKMMLGSKLQGFINQFADMLAKINY